MSKPRKDTVLGPCSYCTEEQEMEPEHVVPRSIFINKNQAKVVIPACRECNNEKSGGEGDLRDYLIIRVGVDGHPDIFPLMKEMAESYRRGSSKLGQAASEERELKTRRTSSGVHILGYEVPIHDPGPMDLTLRYMVRGLHFYETGRPWLKSQPLSLSMVEDEDFDATIEHFQHIRPFTWGKPLGNDVFKWMPFFSADDPQASAWLMVFFGRVAVVGWIGIPEDDDERELTFSQLIRRKGKREKQLGRIVDRGLVKPPPSDLMGFLGWHEARKRKTSPQ